jgi:hypothetical protein
MVMSTLSFGNAHMPFALVNQGHWCFVFCRAESRHRRRGNYIVAARRGPWKLHWAYATVPAMGRIGTGLPEDAIECSPSVSIEDHGLRVSFIGTCRATRHPIPGRGSETTRGHRLYVMAGPSVDQLSLAAPVSDEECYCGFSRSDLTVMATGLDGRARLSGSHSGYLETSFGWLHRISFRADRPAHLLLTGSRFRQLPFTLLYDLETDRVLGEVRVEGKATYKPTIWDRYVCAPREPYCKVDWSLCYADHFELLATDVSVRRI